MGALAYLEDRTDPRVQAALTRRCGICAAVPDDDCQHPWGGTLGRVVHQERAEQHLDKKRKGRG